MSNYKMETKCIQSGYQPGNGEPRVLPIYQSTTYTYDSTEHIAQLFDLSADGHMYSRISNPTVAAVEQKIAALEGGVGALCTTSGQAASLLAVLNICTAGDHFVAASTIYGGTVNLFAGFAGTGESTVEVNTIHHNEINVNGSTAYKLEDYPAAAEMIKSGKIDADKIVTHRFKIEDFQKAYDVCAAGAGLKVIIEP